MTTRERIDADYNQAAKDRDAAAVSVLRLLRAALKNAEIDKMSALEEDDVVSVVSREAKKLRDSLEDFRKGQRDDLLKQTEAEVAFMERYLPQQLTDDEIAALAAAKVQALEAATPKDFGRVMSEVMKEVKGRADGSRVSAAVKQALESA